MSPVEIDNAGTHNLLDGAAEGEGWAKVMLLTEAPMDIRSDLIAATHRLFRVRRQRDLVIGMRFDIAKDMTNVKRHYKLVHIGVVKVTPHRGIFWLTFEYDGKRYAVICEHRINAWFKPWIRGERWFRERMWHRHESKTVALIKRLEAKGYEVIIAGGDPNTLPGVPAYGGELNETLRANKDRVAVNRPIRRAFVNLPKRGSDHHGVKAYWNNKEAA